MKQNLQPAFDFIFFIIKSVNLINNLRSSTPHFRPISPHHRLVAFPRRPIAKESQKNPFFNVKK